MENDCSQENNGWRVLVVDDDSSIARLTREILKDPRLDVRVTESGREAAELLRQERFELLVTDIFMPEVDGFEIIRQVRRDAPSTKIIVMTGERTWMRGGHRKIASDLGADCVLSKPCNMATIRQAVKEVLSDDSLF